MRSLAIFCLALLVQGAQAQPPAYPPAPSPAGAVTNAEYFIDTDPGVGNGTAIPVTAAVDIPSLLGSINTSTVEPGVHRLYVRTRSAAGHWSFTHSLVFGISVPYPAGPPVATAIVAAEYFIDADPGVGNGTAIPVTAAVDIPSLLGSINTSTVEPGVHRLYVRTRSAAGHWSLTNSLVFAVSYAVPYPDAPPVVAPVDAAEYFIDADPGVGNGTAIPVTAAVDIPSLLGSINTSTVEPGVHRLYVRTRSAAGHWSLTNSLVFAVSYAVPYPDAPPVVAPVDAAEYFIDADPGVGNGTAIPVTAAVDIPSLLGSINTSTVEPGVHRLYVRTRSAAGHWSLTNSLVFAVSYAVPYPDAPPVVAPVDAAEYFIDADPGLGNGTAIPVTAAVDIPSLLGSINTSTVEPGVHRLYVRTRSAAGHWSLTHHQLLAVVEPYPTAPKAPGAITQLEYFVDADPGFGNGTPINFTPAADVSNILFTVNTASLSSGTHYLFVRSKNKWSITQFLPFTVEGALPLKHTRFTAKKDRKQVLLEWKTEQETGVSHFEIERSKNGMEFQSIGRVPARNGTNNLYRLADSAPYPQLNYYRLKMVDVDGTTTYSEIRSVLFSSFGSTLAVYPNPVRNQVLVRLAGINAAKLSVQLYSQSGARVKSWVLDGQPQLTLPVEDLAAGVYYLQISTGSDIYQARFVKQ